MTQKERGEMRSSYPIWPSGRLTGGPWGTVDQVDAARMAATLMEAGRRAACRVTTRSVESIIVKMERRDGRMRQVEIGLPEVSMADGQCEECASKARG